MSATNLSYADLTNPATVPQALAYLQTLLTSSGIQGVTDWTPNSPQMAFLQVAAFIISNVQGLAATNAFNSVEPNAAGDWLDNVSSANFDNQRFQGTQTQLRCTCSLGAGFGPDSFQPGDIQVTFAGAFPFTNASAFSLNGNASSVQAFVASTPASAPNSVTGGSVGSLTNNIQGLTVTTANQGNLFNGCVTVQGTDTEGDPALHLRNETKWSTLATAETQSSRLAHAVLTYSSGALSDVFIPPYSTRGPGCVDVFCSDPDNPATPTQLAAISGSVQAEMIGGSIVNFGTDTSGLARVALQAPSPVYFGSGGQNTQITVWYQPLAPLTQLETNLTQALNAWVGSVPTGGVTYGVAASNIADVDGLISALYAVQFVQKVRIANQADVSLFSAGSTPLKLTAIDWSNGGRWDGATAGSVALIQGI